MVYTDNANEATTPELTNAQPNESNERASSSVNEEKEADNAKEQAQEWQKIIKEAVVWNALAWAEWKSDRFVVQKETQASLDLKSYNWYIEVLTQLLFEIKWCEDTAKYKTWLNLSWKQTLRTARAKLKQYKDIINDKKRTIEHEFNVKNKLNPNNPDRVPLEVNISKSEINELKNRRFRRKQQIEYDIKEWQSWKSSNTAPWPNQSLEQVISWNRVDVNHNEYDQRLNEALHDSAFLRVFDNNQEAARRLLQWIANNSLSDQQIVFCQVHMQELAPHFENYWLRDQVYTNIQTRGGRYTQSYVNYWNIDGKTAYKTGWVTGWLNNTLIKAFPNAKPEQVSNLTNVAVAAGWIYALYRIWKRFFWKNHAITDEEGKVIWHNRNLLWKTALLAWGYFVPQLLLWKDWYSLLWEILTWKADFSELKYRASNSLRFMHGSSPEVYAQMAPGLLWMTMFPQTYTVDNVRALQQTFSDQNARRQRYSTTYTRLNKDNSALANEFQNTFNANQYNENERKVFLAKLWITEKTSGDAIIFKEAMKTADKKTSFELWIKSQWKKTNPAFKKDIDNYLKQEWEFNPDELNQNRFLDNTKAKYTIREVDFKNKEALNNKVDSLALDPQKKSNLKSALETFYDERTIESKPNVDDFSLDLEANHVLIIKSHWWNETKLDLSSNTLKWFWSTNWNSYEIRFSSLSEALQVADLTNDILHMTDKQIPAANPPFKYEQTKKAICFNNAKLISLDFDTRILNINRFKDRWTIDKHATEYADYLSNCRLRKSQVEVTSYPLVNELSKTWIIFTNEEEVKQLNNRLNKTKNDLSVFYATPKGSPFSIRSIDNKIVFTAINGDKMVLSENISDKFPTILANKDKFLAFMNDTNNWMYKPSV